MRHAFIITFGRSGSTLLMGYLNRLEGACIRGENKGAVIPLWRHYRRVQEVAAMKGLHNAHTPTHPWYGMDTLDVDDLRRDLGGYVTRQFCRPTAGAHTVGFKEIRHTPEWIDDLDDYLAFLLELFEDTRLVFHTRAVVDAAKSGWWATVPGAEYRLAAVRDRFAASRFAADPRVIHTTYEDFLAGPEEAARIAAFLGLRPGGDAWAATLAERHSY